MGWFNVSRLSIKADLEPLSGPRVFAYVEWRKGGVNAATGTSKQISKYKLNSSIKTLSYFALLVIRLHLNK